MPRQQVKHLLQTLQSYHDELRSMCAASRATHEQGELLLQHVDRRQQHLKLTLQRYEEDERERVLNAWFRYVPERNPLAMLADAKASPKHVEQNVFEVVLKLDAFLVQWCDDIAARAIAPNVKDLFAEIAKMEKAESLALANDIMSLRQI